MSASTPLLRDDEPHPLTHQGPRAHRRASFGAPGGGGPAVDFDLGLNASTASTSSSLAEGGVPDKAPRWAGKQTASGARLGRGRWGGRNLGVMAVVGLVVFAGLEGVRFRGAGGTGEVAGSEAAGEGMAEAVAAAVSQPVVERVKAKVAEKGKGKGKSRLSSYGRPSAPSPTAAPVAANAAASPSVALDRSKLAFMIEPRHQPILVPVLLDFLRKVPDEWPHLLLTSAATAASVALAPRIQPHLASGKLALKVIPEKWDVHDGHSLSAFMADSWLWEELAPAEYCELCRERGAGWRGRWR